MARNGQAFENRVVRAGVSRSSGGGSGEGEGGGGWEVVQHHSIVWCESGTAISGGRRRFTVREHSQMLVKRECASATMAMTCSARGSDRAHCSTGRRARHAGAPARRR